MPNKDYTEDPQKRDLEKEMGTADFRYSWMRMQAVAQDTARWRQVVHGLCSTGTNKT